MGPAMLVLLGAYLVAAPIAVLVNAHPPSYFTVMWAFMPFSMAASLVQVYTWHAFAVEVESVGDDGGDIVRSVWDRLQENRSCPTKTGNTAGVAPPVTERADVMGAVAASERSALAKVAISALWPHGGEEGQQRYATLLRRRLRLVELVNYGSVRQLCIR